MNDRLEINYNNKKLGFTLSYGYLDSVASAFDFEKQEQVDIERFNLSVDSDSLEEGEYLILEELSENPKKLIDAELSLDGLTYSGKASLARFFNISGLNINLQLFNKAG